VISPSGLPDPGDPVIRPLPYHQVRRGAGAGDMLAQIGQVDPRPDLAGEIGDGLAVHPPEAGVEGGRVVLGRLPEAQEPGQVPGLQVGLFGVEVEEEVEGVGWPIDDLGEWGARF